MNDASVLETERLKLRGHGLDDLADCAAMWSDPAVTRYIGGKPFSAQQVWMKILNYTGHWALMGFGYWVIEEKATGYFVGELGFADFKREMEPSIKGIPELGWALAPSMHGKGYATEAARAAVAWGDTRFERARTVCLISPENVASIRVAEKIGYKEYRRTAYNGEPTLLFARPSHE
ncbi:MAG TPA: GNAT family N-acetyltransferase [Candidatus Baltobacteraceae bacterium]|jgi:RimJ/RimL family protein N-acetyltransferase